MSLINLYNWVKLNNVYFANEMTHVLLCRPHNQYVILCLKASGLLLACLYFVLPLVIRFNPWVMRELTFLNRSMSLSLSSIQCECHVIYSYMTCTQCSSKQLHITYDTIHFICSCVLLYCVHVMCRCVLLHCVHLMCSCVLLHNVHVICSCVVLHCVHVV